MEKAKLMWRVHGCFRLLDEYMQVVASGPAENIYEALGAAKSYFAFNFPKLDTGTIFIDFVEASNRTVEGKELEAGWCLVPIDEV